MQHINAHHTAHKLHTPDMHVLYMSIVYIAHTVHAFHIHVHQTTCTPHSHCTAYLLITNWTQPARSTRMTHHAYNLYHLQATHIMLFTLYTVHIYHADMLPIPHMPCRHITQPKTICIAQRDATHEILCCRYHRDNADTDTCSADARDAHHECSKCHNCKDQYKL